MSARVFPRFDTSTFIDLPPEVEAATSDAHEKHVDSISSVSVSSDSLWLVTASFDNTCIVWALDNGDFQISFSGHSDRVTSAAFFADNEHVVSCSLDQTTQIWKSDTGQAIRTLTGHSAGVESLALSVDNSILVTGSWDSTCIIWRLDTYCILHTLSGHSGWVRSVAISEDNSVVVSGSIDNSCRIWNVESGLTTEVLYGHSAHVNSVTISPDNAMIVSGSQDGTVKLWNSSTGLLMSTLEGHSDAVMAVAVSLDGACVYSAGADRTVRSWNLSAPIKAGHIYKGHSSTVTCVCVTKNSRMVVSAGTDACAKLWSPNGGSCRRTIDGRKRMGVAEKKARKEAKAAATGQPEIGMPRRQRKGGDSRKGAPIELERDDSFSFHTKASLYEVKDMLRRVEARTRVIGECSLWEQKEFIGTIQATGEAVGERVFACYTKESVDTSLSFMTHTLKMLEPVAACKPDIVSAALDATLAKLLRDAYKNGLIEAVTTTATLLQPLPIEKLCRTMKCLSRIDNDVSKNKVNDDDSEAEAVTGAISLISS